MKILRRIKGLVLSPSDEWAVIEGEEKSVPELYRGYILYLALIPPFASFLSGYLFGFGLRSELAELSLSSGLARAALQYVWSLPLLYLSAFALSSLAPHFDGKSDDSAALALLAYSYTPAWLASAFALVPGLRWLDALGYYGVLVFYRGFSRMLKMPKGNGDVFTFVALILTIGMAALHAGLVRLAAPWRLL